MKSPLISVLVCNYNYADYIVETLDSIVNQDYKNIEIVVIDDGSTDGSDKVIRKYAERHKNKKIVVKIEEQNQGICYARNLALDVLSGEFFVFVDSDDTIPTNYITELYSVYKSSSSDVVYTDIKYFGAETGSSNFPEYSREELQLHNYINISALVKTSSVGDSRFDLYLNRMTLEDWDFWLGLSLKGLKFIKADGVYLNYRVQERSRNNNTAGITKRLRDFIHVWAYCISKYRNIYPTKLVEDIEVRELEFQVIGLAEDLDKTNIHIQKVLQPAIESKDIELDRLRAALDESRLRYEGLVNSKRVVYATRILNFFRPLINSMRFLSNALKRTVGRSGK